MSYLYWPSPSMPLEGLPHWNEGGADSQRPGLQSILCNMLAGQSESGGGCTGRFSSMHKTSKNLLGLSILEIKDQDQTWGFWHVISVALFRTWVSCSTWGSVQAGWRAARDFVERCSTLGFSIGMSPTLNPAHSTNCQIVYVCLSKGPGPNLMVNIPLNNNPQKHRLAPADNVLNLQLENLISIPELLVVPSFAKLQSSILHSLSQAKQRSSGIAYSLLVMWRHWGGC